MLCLCKYNARNVFRQLEDKYAFYSFNKKYFKRNILKIDKVSEYEQFSNFVHTNKNFIMKPLSGQCGEGISIYKEVNSNLDQLFSKFKSISGGVVLETLVVQSKIMAIWNETSVNTVRIPSFRTRKGIYVLQPFLRTGRYGSCVDNGGSGGIFAVIDDKTGIVITDGCNERRQHFIEHPDSHVIYRGWQVPNWDELMSLVKEIHSNLPSDFYYVGFDFAFTDYGWVLIEGNWGQFVGQYCNQQGVRKEFTKLIFS